MASDVMGEISTWITKMHNDAKLQQVKNIFTAGVIQTVHPVMCLTLLLYVKTKLKESTILWHHAALL